MGSGKTPRNVVQKMGHMFARSAVKTIQRALNLNMNSNAHQRLQRGVHCANFKTKNIAWIRNFTTINDSKNESGL